MPDTEIQSLGDCSVTSHPCLPENVVFTGLGQKNFSFKTKNVLGKLGQLGLPDREGMGTREVLPSSLKNWKKVEFPLTGRPPPSMSKAAQVRSDPQQSWVQLNTSH